MDRVTCQVLSHGSVDPQQSLTHVPDHCRVKDTFSGRRVLLAAVTVSGPVPAQETSAVYTCPAASVPMPASTVRHRPVPEPTQGSVAPLPEAGPRARLSVRTESRRRQQQQRRRGGSGRPVGPARAALLPVAREDGAVSVRSVVWHQEAEVWRLVGHVWQHVVRMVVSFPCPWRSAAARPATIPPPDRHTVLGFIIADLSVFELALLSRRAAHFIQIHVGGPDGPSAGREALREQSPDSEAEIHVVSAPLHGVGPLLCCAHNSRDTTRLPLPSDA